jgi:hypothetical protein
MLIVLTMVGTPLIAAAEPAAKSYQLTGQWIESCTCSVPCGCVMTGNVPKACEGVLVLSVRSGRYGDVNLAGAKVAVPHQPGGWAIVYFDPATTSAQREALTAIMEPQAKAFGLKIEAVKTAPITVSGENGRFTVTIPDILTLQTEPVLGLDKARPIEHRNMPDPFIQNCFQARSVSGSFKDSGHEISLQGTNAFWANVRRKG